MVLPDILEKNINLPNEIKIKRCLENLKRRGLTIMEFLGSIKKKTYYLFIPGYQ